ncbi:hypothetical protein LLH00_14175 [bacterium]|nr:hypothetical protein [bacterium]
MTFECIFATYIGPTIPIVAAVLLYFFGRMAYFRQKEFEMVTKRYLEDGLDVISRNVSETLASFMSNYCKGYSLLRHYKNIGKDLRPELYRNAFIEPERSHLSHWREYRLHDIVGDDIFFKANQSLYVFERKSYDFFQDDLGLFIKAVVEGGDKVSTKVSKDEAIEIYSKKIQELYVESTKYYALLGIIEELSAVIQTKRLAFGSIKKFRNTKEVDQLTKKLKKYFPELLDAKDLYPEFQCAKH